jgi:D-xylose transport system substrate-binding protein
MALAGLKQLAARGRGGVGVILPGSFSSARYVDFDAPDIEKGLEAAGLTRAQFSVVNTGSDAAELSAAKADVSEGDEVLVVDPLDDEVGASIESYALSHGVKVVDYDRLTLGGSREYYVGFSGTGIGTLLGQGLVGCVSAWHVSRPRVLVIGGPSTDANAVLFARGYDAVLAPHFKSGAWAKVGQAAGTWGPPEALAEFERARSANAGIDALLVADDDNAAAIIGYLRARLRTPPRTVPVTGQGATLAGLGNILRGYQCGTVYKPVYREAEAAAALAAYLRADVRPPAALVDGIARDRVEGRPVPAVLVAAEWVTASNMASTVLADGFVKADQLCAAPYGTAAACEAAGIAA